MREIIAVADRANQFIDDKKPWVMAKEEGREQKFKTPVPWASTVFAY